MIFPRGALTGIRTKVLSEFPKELRLFNAIF